MAGTRYYGRDMYIPITIPIPNWKSRRFPIPIRSKCGDSPWKRGWVRAIPTGVGLFAISSYRWVWWGIEPKQG